MTWLTWATLETPWVIAGVMFTVCFSLLSYWRRGNSPRPLLVGLALAGAALAAQAFVETRREMALRLMQQVETDVREGRTGRMGELLAVDFRAGGMGRQEFLDYCAGQFARVRFHSVQNLGLQVAESGSDQFVTTARYLCDISVGEWGRRYMRSTWRLSWQRAGGSWQLRSIEPVSIDGVDIADWGTIDQRR